MGGSMRRPGALVAAAILAGCTVAARPDGSPPMALRVLPAGATASLTYVALGDSTVEGVGASAPARNYVSRLHERLRSVFPEAKLANLGEGGATASGVLYRQLPLALDLRPRLVTLSVGPNDITGRRALADYARDIDGILRALATGTGAVVVVTLIPDLGVTPRFRGQAAEPLVRQRVIEFNEVLGRQARAYGAEVVDLYGPSREEVPRRPDLIGADRYHPSDAGYARWAELMWVAIHARIQWRPGADAQPARRAAPSARQIRSGVTGISTCAAPAAWSASHTAFMTAAGAPVAAFSPAPFTPSGLSASAIGRSSTSNDGRSSARAIV